MSNVYLNKHCKIKNLLEYGFRKNKKYYELIKPIYINNNCPVISVKFIISLDDSFIDYDVINNNSGELYTHFYNREYGNQKQNKVLKIIINELNKILKEMKSRNIISG